MARFFSCFHAAKSAALPRDYTAHTMNHAIFAALTAAVGVDAFLNCIHIAISLLGIPNFGVSSTVKCLKCSHDHWA